MAGVMAVVEAAEWRVGYLMAASAEAEEVEAGIEHRQRRRRREWYGGLKLGRTSFPWRS